MAIDFQGLLYDPVYSIIGVDAVLHLWSGDYPLTAIDKTSGVEIKQSVDIGTVSPAASVRASDIAAAGLTLADIDGGTLTINGEDWKVVTLHNAPSPSGAEQGEVYLMLQEIPDVV